MRKMRMRLAVCLLAAVWLCGCTATPPASSAPESGRIHGTEQEPGAFELTYLYDAGTTVTDIAFYNDETLLICYTSADDQAGFAAFDVESGAQVTRRAVSCDFAPRLRLWKDGSFSLVPEGTAQTCLFFRSLFDPDPFRVDAPPVGERVFVDKTEYYRLHGDTLYHGTAYTETEETMFDLTDDYDQCALLGAVDGAVILYGVGDYRGDPAAILCCEGAKGYEQLECPIERADFDFCADGEYLLRQTARGIAYRHSIEAEQWLEGAEAPVACDGERLMTAQAICRLPDGAVLFHRDGAAARCGAFSPDGTMAAMLCAGEDGSVRAWIVDLLPQA